MKPLKCIFLLFVMLFTACLNIFAAEQDSAAVTPVTITQIKPTERKIPGNFMYRSDDLINFESQLNYIEQSFWRAASLSKSEKLYIDIEKKLSALANLARVIQATLVAEKKNSNLNIYRDTIKLYDLWRDLAGKRKYYYDNSLLGTSRNSYGLYNKEIKASYQQWLEKTIIYNMDQFSQLDDRVLNTKLSDYFKVIKELRCAIADVDDLNLFDKNPQLSKSQRERNTIVNPALIDTKFLAALPIPNNKLDPAIWQWSQDEAGRVLDFLGRHGQQQQHYLGPVIPKSFNDPISRNPGAAPAVTPFIGGMTYVNWDFGLDRLVDLSIDVTFHSKPLPPASCYLQLYDGGIGSVGQYFGFQYIWEKTGKLKQQFIWSRWKTRDKGDAWVANGGWIESAGYEGDFVGIRYPVVFDAESTFTVHVQMRETDAKGTWYELRIFDHQKQQWTKVGRLRFPPDNGKLPFINNGGGSWTEAFAGVKYSSDVAKYHLSYGGIYTCGRTVAARSVTIFYSDKIPNTDVSIEPEGRSIHIVYGGKTLRRTKAGTYPLPPEKMTSISENPALSPNMIP